MLREVVSNEWFTIFIVFCLLILAIAKLSFSKRFNEYIGVIGNSKYLKIYGRDQKFIDQFDALLFINLVISISIFSLLSYSTLISELSFDIFLYLKIVLAIGAVLLIKVLIERLIGSLFDLDEIMDVYVFQKTNYRNYIGLILLPINVILIYGIQPNPIIIYSIIGILIIVLLSGFFTTFKSYQKLFLGNLFYFILYLCALEIGPYIILYKALT